MRIVLPIALLLFAFCAQTLQAQTPGTKRWQFSAGNTVTPPVVDDKGTIYFGSDTSIFYALNPDGTEKWRFAASAPLHGAPAIGADGSILFGTTDSKFYALNPNGSMNWAFTPGAPMANSAAIGVDGSIYLGAGNSLYALNPDGSTRWRFDATSGFGASSPAIGLDGTIYIGSDDNLLYAINGDGSSRWTYQTTAALTGGLALDSGGAIYSPGVNGVLFAVNPNGTKKWNYLTLRGLSSNPVLGLDGTVYVSSDKLYAIRKDGTLKWTYAAGLAEFGAPVVGQSGNIYVPSESLICLSPDRTKLWELPGIEGERFGNITIGPGGTLYVPYGTQLWAVESSDVPATSDWPMFQRNRKHSGRLGNATAPGAVIDEPKSGESYAAGSTINIAATPFTENSVIRSVAFYDGLALLRTTTNAPYVLRWTNLPFGPHTLTAVASDAFQQKGTSAPVNITVDTDAAYVVQTGFSPHGTIQSAPVPGRYPLNTPVTLAANPQEGYTFVEWTGDAAGTTNPLTFLLSSNTTVSAHFEPLWKFGVNEGVGGTVQMDPETNAVLNGTTVKLEAHTAPGFAFQSWSGSISSTANPLFINVSKHLTVTANFVETTIRTDILGQGAISELPIHPPDFLHLVGDAASLLVVPADNYRFLRWSDGDKTNPRSVLIGTNNYYKALLTNIAPTEIVHQKQWDRSYGGLGPDSASRIIPTLDGGFFLAGTSGQKTSAGFGKEDYWVVKIDAAGNQLWDQHYGGSGSDTLSSACATPDGGLILFGTSGSERGGTRTAPRYGETDFWAVRIAENGSVIWDRSFGGTLANTGRAICATKDGGFLLAGYSTSGAGGNKASPGYGAEDFWVVKINHDGVKQWDSSFGGSGGDKLYAAIPLDDGGFLLGGYTGSPTDGTKTSKTLGGYDYWLIKIDAHGSKRWEQVYGGYNNDFLTHILPRRDGTYLLAGHSNSYPHADDPPDYRTSAGYGFEDTWVLCVDSGGFKIWEKAFGGDGNGTFPGGLIETGDGGFLLATSSAARLSGVKTLPLIGGTDYWIIRADENGEILWQDVFGGDNSDNCHDIILAADGGILLAGDSSSADNGNKTSLQIGQGDFWLVKLRDAAVRGGTPGIYLNGEFQSGGDVTLFDPATLDLHTTGTDATIFYSLDGTEPTSASHPFSASFSISSNVTIRARALIGDTYTAEPASVTVVFESKSPRLIYAIASPDLREIDLTFDKKVGNSATNPASYTIPAGATILSARLGEDSATVILTYSGALSSTFTITAANISGVSGPPGSSGLIGSLEQSPPPPTPNPDDNWDPRFGLNNVSSPLYALTFSSANELYVGGMFAGNGDVNINNVAQWDGSHWSALGTPGTNGTSGLVFALASVRDQIYVGGAFGGVGPGPDAQTLPVNSIARWDGAWHQVGSSIGFGVAGTVYALATDGTNLVVAGIFFSAGSVPATNIAKWDGTRWTPLGSGLGIAGQDIVYALAFGPDGTLYAGGKFKTAGATTVNFVAAWNGTEWRALDYGSDAPVHALAWFGTNLLAGGEFTTAGSLPAKKLAKWNGTSWGEFGNGLSGGDVYALTTDGDRFYAGGTFTQAGAVSALTIAKWDGDWSSVGSGFSDGHLSTSGSAGVFAIKVRENVVYAAGDFRKAGDLFVPGIAKFADNRWSGLNEALLAYPLQVTTVASAGTNVFAAGAFDIAGDVTAPKLARWNGTDWSALGDAGRLPPDGQVLAIAQAPAGDVFVGGGFRHIGGVAAQHIARWDGTNWFPVGAGVDDTQGGNTILAIAFDSAGHPIIGGYFEASAGVTLNNVGLWDGSAWKPLGTGFDGWVQSLAVRGEEIYAAGSFIHAGATVVNCIARWDGQAWQPLGSGLLYPGFQADVNAIAISDRVYAGGTFTSAGGVSARGLASWDGTQWQPVGDVTGGWVKSLLAIGPNLYVGGDFTNIAGLNIPDLARWNGAQWAALGSGIGGFGASVLSLAQSGSDLYVAGTFRTAGAKSANGFSRWSLNQAPPSIRITSPLSDSIYSFSTPIEIRVEAAASEGDLDRVEFFANSTFIGSNSNAPFSLTWSNTVAGEYTISAKAFDTFQASAVSLPVHLVILPPTSDAPPSVTLLSPKDGDLFTSDSTLTLAANASDLDGHIAAVNFYNGAELLGSVANPPYQLALTNPAPGNYSLVAEAVDDLGASSLSPVANVLVVRLNRPPFIQWNAPQSGQQFTAPGNVTISADASDSDGRVVRLDFLADGQFLESVSEFGGGTSFNYIWTNPPVGVHEITARAFDDAGAESSAGVAIVVNGPDAYSLAQVLPATEPKNTFWVTDGLVRTILETNSIVYIGGDFTHVGPLVTGSVPVGLASSPPDFTYPIVQGVVNAIADDGTGGYFIGGAFTAVSGIPRANLAHVLANHQVDLSWAPSADGAITQIVPLGQTLYLCGGFNAVNGQYRPHAAAIDTVFGDALEWNPQTDGPVEAIAATPQAIYLAGTFNYVSGQLHQFIAATDPLFGEPSAWNPVPDAPVHRILFAFGQLYATGEFRNIGGQSAIFIAALDPGTGRPTGFRAAVDSQVLALAASSSSIYLGGNFLQISGENRHYLAALDPFTGQALPFNPNADGSVSKLSILNGVAYAIGEFTNIGLKDRNRIAALDAITGAAEPLDLQTKGLVSALGIAGDQVLAYGSGALALLNRGHLAAIDAGTGVATGWAPSADSAVLTLVVASNTLYCGGDFTAMNGVSRPKIAAFNAATGELLPWNPGVGGRVQTLAASSRALYVGGYFTGLGENGTLPRNYAAAYDLATGAVLPWNPGFNDGVLSLAFLSNSVYAAGAFTQAGGLVRNHAAAADAITGTITPWNPNANGFVVQLLATDQGLVAAGGFHAIGGRARDSVAILDPVTGNSSLWAARPNASVVAVASANQILFTGGDFATMGGAPRLGLAALDQRIDSSNTTDWTPALIQIDPYIPSIGTLAASANTIYASGLTMIGREPRPYLAAFDLPPRLQITHGAGEAQAVLSVAGSPGRFYAIESSSGFLSWKGVLTNFGPFTVPPLPLTNSAARFFRAVVPEIH